uniref:Small ribosomal subunit protein bS18c n=1 Tax=Prototheca wickerhamii TaxID=3111 RepID=A0A873HVX2_PROWI|nr:ribosomal protein S18 [Prototheca wickerhamii]QOZ41703.1 ribosomal protein S18 [Prototheca wickerhamii]
MKSINQVRKNLIFKKNAPFILNDNLIPIYNVHTIEYKNTVLLKYFVNAAGKILPKTVTKLTAKQQRHIAKAIKRSRINALCAFQKPLTFVINKNQNKKNKYRRRLTFKKKKQID